MCASGWPCVLSGRVRGREREEHVEPVFCPHKSLLTIYLILFQGRCLTDVQAGIVLSPLPARVAAGDEGSGAGGDFVRTAIAAAPRIKGQGVGGGAAIATRRE